MRRSLLLIPLIALLSGCALNPLGSAGPKPRPKPDDAHTWPQQCRDIWQQERGISDPSQELILHCLGWFNDYRDGNKVREEARKFVIKTPPIAILTVEVEPKAAIVTVNGREWGTKTDGTILEEFP